MSAYNFMQKFLNFSSNIYYEKNSLKNVENNSFRNSFAKKDARVKITYSKLIQIYSRLFQTIYADLQKIHVINLILN